MSTTQSLVCNEMSIGFEPLNACPIFHLSTSPVYGHLFASIGTKRATK